MRHDPGNPKALCPRRPRGGRAVSAAAVAWVLVAVGVVPGFSLAGRATAAVEASKKDSGFVEVNRLELMGPPDVAVDSQKSSGWLILNPESRRAYQVFETGTETIVQSFDLDSLKPLRRIRLAGIPIAGGHISISTGGGTSTSGEIVHAVDGPGHRLYLALNLTAVGLPVPSVADFTASPDSRRQFGRIAVIDEDKLDANPDEAVASLVLAGAESRLQAHFLMGLATSRHHLADPGGPADLLALFAAPHRPPLVPFAPATPMPLAYDHTLVQWPTSGLLFGPDERGGRTSTPTPTAADWAQVLAPCARAPVSSPVTSSGVSPSFDSNYQWGILATADAIWTVCQSEPYSGAALRVGLAEVAGRRQPNAADQQVFPLSQPVSDVFVDEGAERLLLRSFGDGGTTWWAFDTASRRYTGSAAATTAQGQGLGAGVDPSTGRLYGLTQDYVTGNTPLRGGLLYTDTRLEPVAPLANVEPGLAYPSYWRIAVDPPTRRFFVRRGGTGSCFVYPATNAGVPCPPENFYRVFEDRIPVPTQPADVDDSAFTTDTPEAEGVTTASYLGSGQGYGVRTVLTGGLAALTTGASDLGDPTRSRCSREDRELVSGAAGPVSVSDLSVGAEAASFDADARTRESFGNPVSRCKPTELNQASECSETADTDELSFDEPKDPREDKNPADGCADRDGTNRYATRCDDDDVGEKPAKEIEGKKAPRKGFSAAVACDRADDTAKATSTGSLGAAELDGLQATLAPTGAVPADSFVRVATATSTVTVRRREGGGVETTVDSIARGIEIPGVGRIGVARATSTSHATGQVRRGARGTFERTICDVELGGQKLNGACLSDSLQRDFVRRLNEALTGKGRARLREPDGKLADGSDSGYRAAVQRDRRETFADRVIDRDNSLAVPALEIVLYVGDGANRGAGRQIVQLAGAQAATTYGIACLYGQKDDGKCARADEYGFDEDDLDVALPPEPGEPVVVTETVTETVVEPGEPSTDDGDGKGGGNRIIRIIQRIPELAADALRLLFNNPREFGLLAAVWALLYAPCYLGERRRSIRGLRARRTILGGPA